MLDSTPPDQRLTKWPVLGRLPPNLVVIELTALNEHRIPVRAVLTEPDFQTVRVFVSKNIDAPITDGRDDYTIEKMQLYVAQVKAKRRRDWIIMLTVWLAVTAFFSWQFLKGHAQTPRDLQS